MIRVKLLSAAASGDKELWFSSPEKADEYLAAARFKDPDLNYERDDLDDLAAELIDPEPPSLATIYTAIWWADTAEGSLTQTRVGVEHAAEIPALSVSTVDVTHALHPLTRARWAHLAGVFRVVSVTGVDQGAVQDEMKRTLLDLQEAGKLLDKDTATTVVAENQEEYHTYIWPITAARARINGLNASNFLGVNTIELAEAERDLFELLDNTDRQYKQQFDEMGFGAAPPHPAGRPLDIAVQVAAGFDAVSDSMIFGAVRAERNAGASWQDIAGPLGITRQAAQIRYADQLRKGPVVATDLYLVAKSVQGETNPVHWFGRLRASVTVNTIADVVDHFASGLASNPTPIIESFLNNDELLLSGMLSMTPDGRSLHLMRGRR